VVSSNVHQSSVSVARAFSGRAGRAKEATGMRDALLMMVLLQL